MSIQRKSEVIEQCVNVLKWNRDVVEALGQQHGWDLSKMEQAQARFFDNDPETIKPQQQFSSQVLNRQQINDQNLDDQKQLYQALALSQQEQGNKSSKKRIKIDDYPLGFENLDNDCQFNYLLQIIFYNPVLVKLILQYKLSSQGNTEEILQLILKFMIEFQGVIANQIISNQNYIKPQQFFEIAKKFEKKILNQNIVQNVEQNDVGEYLTNFLQLIDLAFTKNPIKHKQQNIFQCQELKNQYIIKQEDQDQLLWPISIKDQQMYKFLYKEMKINNTQIKGLPQNLVFKLERNIQKNKKTEKSEDKFYISKNICLDFMLGDQQALQNVQKYIDEQIKNLPLYKQLQKQVEAFEEVVNYYKSLSTYETFVFNSLKFQYNKKVQELKQPDTLLSQELQKSSKHLYFLSQIVVHKDNKGKSSNYLYQFNYYLKKWFKYDETEISIQTEEDVISDSIKHGYILIYLSQDQKAEVEKYQQQLHEIEMVRKQRGLDLLKFNNANLDLLLKIPQKICEAVLKENESFLRKLEE